MRGLVGVVVYNRVDTIDNWLWAWNQCDHLGFSLAVVHNGEPNNYHQQIILKHRPDHYFIRPNVGQDIGAFQYLVNKFQDWDVVFWFTDDVLPMSKDFLRELFNLISDERVGLAGHYWTAKRMRTVAFAMRKEVALALTMGHPAQNREGCIGFEFYMVERVSEMGWDVKAIRNFEPERVGYAEFCKDLYRTWMWDCHRDADLNLWPDFYKVFGRQTVKLL